MNFYFPGPEQLLYLKLYTRNREWIRKHLIRFPEIDSRGDHSAELAALLKSNFLIDCM